MATGQIAQNIARVRERIAQAAARAGRSAEAVTLLAVTKTVDAERIVEAYEAGIRDFGENYVQETLAKIGKPPLTGTEARWHFIGHLQSNKARAVVERFAVIQSVDSFALAQEIGRRAQQAGKVTEILLEVKLDPADAKFGFPLEDVLRAAAQMEQIAGVRVRGLMGMAPFSDDPEASRLPFRTLYDVFEQLPPDAQQTLSMGMTGDFEVAVEEGATLVRIGTAIFGPRNG